MISGYFIMLNEYFIYEIHARLFKYTIHIVCSLDFIRKVKLFENFIKCTDGYYQIITVYINLNNL